MSYADLPASMGKPCAHLESAVPWGMLAFSQESVDAFNPCVHPLGLESGGQSLLTTKGLPPLCTVGAAEFAPPASGRIALFSIAIEFDVFSSPLPEVAAPVVVQLVSGFWPEGVVDCANAGPTTSVPKRIAAAVRIMLISRSHKRLFQIQKIEPRERTIVPRAVTIGMVKARHR